MSNSEKRLKTVVLTIRVAPAERDMLRQKAADVNKTLPAYLIDCGLGRRTRSVVNEQIINELRRLGDLQRNLCIEYNGQLGGEYIAVLLEIVAAVRRIGDA